MPLQIYRTNEAELIKGCRQHNRHAQKQLYDQFSPLMYGLCCRYIKDNVSAEDVMIAGFMKVFEKISQYRGDGSFEGWIRRIMTNEALAYLRKQRSMFVVTELDEGITTTSETGADKHFAQEELIQMINDLPDGYRNVFNLYAIDGFSHKEIAAQLGISENTSKSQLSRARILLQKFLSLRQQTKFNAK